MKGPHRWLAAFRRQAEAEIDDELSFHFERTTDELKAKMR